MAISVLKMAVLSPDGSQHPDAIWVPAQVVMDTVDRAGGVDWYAYHDAPSFLSGKQPIAGVAHHTAIGPALYAQVMAYDAGTGVYGQATAAALAYLALHVADTPGVNPDDTPGVNPDGTPQVGAQGQPVMVPFFQAAQVVQIG